MRRAVMVAAMLVGAVAGVYAAPKKAKTPYEQCMFNCYAQALRCDGSFGGDTDPGGGTTLPPNKNGSKEQCDAQLEACEKNCDSLKGPEGGQAP